MAWLVNDHPFTPLKKNLSENAAMCFTAISSLSRVADSLYWSYNVHKYIHVYCFIRGFCLRGRLITHTKKIVQYLWMKILQPAYLSFLRI